MNAARAKYWGRGWVILLPVAALVLGGYQGGLFAQYCLFGGATALLAFAWGACGILSFAQAVPFGIGAYATAWFSLRSGGWGTVIGLVVGLAIAGIVCVVIGLIGLRGRFEVIAFALITFLIVLAAQQLVNELTNITGGFDGLNSVPQLHVGPAAFGPIMQRVVVCAVVAVVLAALAMVMRSPFGGVMVVVRDAPRRAAALGYNVPAVRIGVFAFTGVVTALLGGLYATQAQSVTGSSIDLALATNFVVWAILGSRTTIAGPFVVALAVNYVGSLLTNYADYWLLGIGALFTAAIVLFPRGAAVALRRVLPHGWRAPQAVRLSVPSGAPAAAGDAAISRQPLTINGVSCRFGPFTAVEDVHIDVPGKGVYCLIGPNGAGKSTLLDVISGFTHATAGRWDVRGKDLTGVTPWRIARAGVARKFQAPAVASALTVGQNIVLACFGPSHPVFGLWRRPWRATPNEEAWSVLRLGGLDHLVDTRAGDLAHGQQQLLELAMSLARSHTVLLLDEPTAGMTPAETRGVGQLLRELVEGGLAIVMVDHDMALIRDVADRVTVLQDGRVLAEGAVAQIEGNQAVRAAYLGNAGA